MSELTDVNADDGMAEITNRDTGEMGVVAPDAPDEIEAASEPEDGQPYRINVALRSLGLPPLIADDRDPGVERMSRWKAAALIVFYTVAYGCGFYLLFEIAMGRLS